MSEQIHTLAILFVICKMAPGGQLVVLKEAVDYAEEESKAGKTETENITIC